MNKSDLILMLNQLDDLQCHLDAIRLHYDELEASIIPPEIKSMLDDMHAERTTTLNSADNGITQLQSVIREAVVTLGESVKGAHLFAIFNKGRVTWDTKRLNGFMVAHPELAELRKVGEPSVTIRKV